MKLCLDIIFMLLVSAYSFSSEVNQSLCDPLEQKIDEILSKNLSRIIKNEVKKTFSSKYEELHEQIQNILEQHSSNHDEKLARQRENIRRQLTFVASKIDSIEKRLAKASSNESDAARESERSVKESVLMPFFDKFKKDFEFNLQKIDTNILSLLISIQTQRKQLILLEEKQDKLIVRIDHLETMQTSSTVSLAEGPVSIKTPGSETLPLVVSENTSGSDFSDEA